MADRRFASDSELWAEAHDALTHFPGWNRIERLLSVRENAIFEVRGAGTPERGVLRLHRDGYQSHRSILSEMLWLRGLDDQGFPVPAPLFADDGQFAVTTTTLRHATLLGWVSGHHVGVPEDPMPIAHRYRQIGAALACLHSATDKLSLPSGFFRPSWDVDGFLGRRPLWGRFWEIAGLAAEDAELFRHIRQVAHDDLAQFQRNGADYGLIHADPLPDNILISDAGPVIIDYDDSGYGFRMYDLAVASYRLADEPDLDELLENLVAGYRDHRHLPDDHWRMLPLFHLLRSLACLGWIESRQDFPGSSDRRSRYLKTARDASLRYLDRKK